MQNSLAPESPLHVTITPIPASHPLARVDLLTLPPEHENPLIWIGERVRMVGWGTAYAGTFSGKHAMRDAAQTWETIRKSASVVGSIPGLSAPIAWGSFGFAWKTSGFLRVPSVAIVESGTERYVVIADSSTTPHPASHVTTPDSRGLPPDTATTPSNSPTSRDSRTTFDTQSFDSLLAGISTPIAPAELGTERGQMTQTEWKDAVAGLIERLKAGAASKAVMSRDMVVTSATTIDPRFIAAQLRELYPTTWKFAVEGLVGASPEMLASVTGTTMLSRVLAGTAAPGQGDELMGSLKDRQEHMFAVESVARALHPIAETLDVPVEPFVLELPNVVHLASDVHAALSSGSNLLNVVAALHPTAAICGTPTPTAFDLLEEFEGTERGRYSGPVGWIDGEGQGEFAIALRCGQIAEDYRSIRIYAGGGIMPDSDPASELRETQAKMRPVLQALGL